MTEKRELSPESVEWLLNRAALAYEAEIRMIEELRQRGGFIFTVVITPCVAIAFYLVSGLKGELWSYTNQFLFWMPWGIAIIFLLIAILLTGYVLCWTFKYSKVGLPSQDLSYFENHPEPEFALEDRKSDLLKEYSQATDDNWSQNERRRTKLLWAQKLVFAAFMLLVFFCMSRWIYNWAQNYI